MSLTTRLQLTYGFMLTSMLNASTEVIMQLELECMNTNFVVQILLVSYCKLIFLPNCH